MKPFFLCIVLLSVGCSAAASVSESSAQADGTQPAPSPAVVQAVDTEAGKVLADGAGLSLYTYDPDVADTSACNGGCAVAWPPLLAPDGLALEAPLGVITRADGTKQVTSEGHPLYRYVADVAQGDVTGDGIGGVWHLARPARPALVHVVELPAGKVLADANGRSLYTFDYDSGDSSSCNGGCAVAWPPLVAPKDATLDAPLGVITRGDGTKQVTSEGHPLYRYAGDAAEGDINGNGISGVWHLAHPAN